MPLLGSVRYTDAEYFKTLEELDNWKAIPRPKFTAPLKYHSRTSKSTAGKLLVCHDYKGGYTESPFALAYTFNYWNVCDTFVYFSHHRVTIPPPGWITAAHRQGVQMLGTLIFENGAESDCLRLLIGKLPQTSTGVAKSGSHPQSLPLSLHYARLLAELAEERGFDGYLLNFECPLQGGLEQTRGLSAWITLLQNELRQRVGPHAQVSWYDSVIVTGNLAWQDRLNSVNLPFFLSSDNIFGNYTWPPTYPAKTASYFLSLDSKVANSKSLQDIYMGVDVWGRGSHGGGGFGAYRALFHAAPQSLGLSVAFFGQAWTWESEQDKKGWSWEKWWEYERLLWVGRKDDDEDVRVPEMLRKEGEPECECVQTPFLPVSSFFGRQPPPDPAHLAMCITFSPGVGRAWFVNGKQVFSSPWTDLDKQTSVGDLVWPTPEVSWEGDEETIAEFDGIVEASSSICMTEAWNGGSSLRLALADKGGERSVYRCVWIPIQGASLTANTAYEAALVYKTEEHADLDVSLSVKGSEGVVVKLVPQSDNDSPLVGGWTKLSLQISVDEACDAAIGLVVALVCEDTDPLSSSLLLGQLTVHLLPTVAHQPSILWADYQASTSNPSSGILLWDVATSFPVLSGLSITSPEDPVPAWDILPLEPRWFPAFVYYNIYASQFESVTYVGGPEDPSVIWIGTSGYEGCAMRFVVDAQNMPWGANTSGKIRFFIQGVLDTGEVLPWERCVYVDRL